MNEYIKSLEQEFSLIKSGFKKEENRACSVTIDVRQNKKKEE